MNSLQIRRFVVVGVLILGIALWLALFTSRVGAAEGALRVDSATAGTGQEVGVGLTAVDIKSPGLGAWTVDVAYDPGVVSLVSCVPKQGGICNESYSDGVLRVTGVSVTGLEGTAVLAHITLRCLEEGTSDLAIGVNVFADASPGDPQPIDAAVEDGSIVCTSEPQPTATPVVPPPPGSDPDKLPGDANCDGEVNAIDAAIVLQFQAGLIVGVDCPQNGDVNHDDEVGAIDAALILQMSAGLLD